MGRLIIVSNRLPATLSDGETGPILQPSTGGLATGLSGFHDAGRDLWIGWSGLPGDDAPRFVQARRAFMARGLLPVSLSHEEVTAFYEGVANSYLWPLFHSRMDGLPLEQLDWPTFEAVNQRFADAIASEYRPGDLVWVHDYHLPLVPGMLREMLPGARVGFFLHIPFPPVEVFQALPARETVLRGMLGADLVGFHTRGYRDNFLAAVREVAGVLPEGTFVESGERRVSCGVFPMGIDTRTWERRATDPAVRARAERIRKDAGGRRILVGVDRLDYTKGIPRRLLAFEHLLESGQAPARGVRLIQVAAPSREGVPGYAETRELVEGIAARINARHPGRPVELIVEGLPADQLSALYAAADVMAVTPLRDGMNLVAKEFVASRVDEDGVLVLSEFAGAADQLDGAMLVNPYDIAGTADALARALAMPADQRREAMLRLRGQVLAKDVRHWAGSFLGRLAAGTPEPRPQAGVAG